MIRSPIPGYWVKRAGSELEYVMVREHNLFAGIPFLDGQNAVANATVGFRCRRHASLLHLGFLNWSYGQPEIL